MTSKSQTLQIFGQVIGSQAVVIGLRSPKEEGGEVPIGKLFLDDAEAAEAYLMALHGDGYAMQSNRQTRRVCDYLMRENGAKVNEYIASFASPAGDAQTP